MTDHKCTGYPKDYKYSNIWFSIEALDEWIKKIQSLEDDAFIIVWPTAEGDDKNLLSTLFNWMKGVRKK